MEGTVNVKMNPNSTITKLVLGVVFNSDIEHESDAQCVADALMGVLILANMVGLEDIGNLMSMADKAQGVARKAALHILEESI